MLESDPGGMEAHSRSQGIRPAGHTEASMVTQKPKPKLTYEDYAKTLSRVSNGTP